MLFDRKSLSTCLLSRLTNIHPLNQALAPLTSHYFTKETMNQSRDHPPPFNLYPYLSLFRDNHSIFTKYNIIQRIFISGITP